MDIKAEIEKIVGKVTKDGELKDKFAKDPAGTVKSLVGDKADSETVSKITDAVKAAVKGGAVADIGSKISGAVGGFFGKKD